jgi:hypothetical protein
MISTWKRTKYDNGSIRPSAFGLGVIGFDIIILRDCSFVRRLVSSAHRFFEIVKGRCLSINFIRKTEDIVKADL